MHAIAQTFNKRRGSKITTILTGERRDAEEDPVPDSLLKKKKEKTKRFLNNH